LVRKAKAKTAPAARNLLFELALTARIPRKSASKLRKRHCVSMRKLRESTSSHGVRANNAAAMSPDCLL
jgi:hypothetical protein